MWPNLQETDEILNRTLHFLCSVSEDMSVPTRQIFLLYYLKGHSISLTLSWRRPLSCRNQSTDLQSKSMDWFLYDDGLRNERVNIDRDISVMSLCIIWQKNSSVKEINNAQCTCKKYQNLFEQVCREDPLSGTAKETLWILKQIALGIDKSHKSRRI